MASLDEFVTDVIRLKEQNRRPQHGAISRFFKWDGMCSYFFGNRSFNHIFQLLDKGYSISHWSKTRGKCQPISEQCHVVDLASRSKNYEFDRVMLTPDIMDMLNSANTPHLQSVTSSIFYVASTRTRHFLSAPEPLREWLEAISYRNPFRR